MNAPLSDALTAANVKIADMALALAKVRPLVKNEIEYPYPHASEQHLAHCRKLLAEVEAALDGTIHAFNTTQRGTQ